VVEVTTVTLEIVYDIGMGWKTLTQVFPGETEAKDFLASINQDRRDDTLASFFDDGVLVISIPARSIRWIRQVKALTPHDLPTCPKAEVRWGRVSGVWSWRHWCQHHGHFVSGGYYSRWEQAMKAATDHMAHCEAA
jgi:hypothetical protein